MGKLPARGEVAPEFELPDSTGTTRWLSQLVSRGPLVLVFYRGYWWPFCLRQLADYRDHCQEIQAAGASVAAVSVDMPENSEALRQQLQLPFPILCDTERRVVREWDIYNSREKGGIAKPAVFVIERDRSVRYGQVDTVSTRVPPSEIVRVLQTAEPYATRRKLYIPGFAEWFRAIRNSIRRWGVRRVL